MTAQELIEQYLVPEHQDEAMVVATIDVGHDEETQHHVHRDEELPENAVWFLVLRQPVSV